MRRRTDKRSRGVRGATTATENTREAILGDPRAADAAGRTQRAPEEITSAFFTVTDDLDAEHPALAAREMGWDDVALLCAREIPVPGGLGRCIRVLLHVNTEKSQEQSPCLPGRGGQRRPTLRIWISQHTSHWNHWRSARMIVVMRTSATDEEVSGLFLLYVNAG